MSDYSSIKLNLDEVNAKIKAAAERAHRNPSDITLIAVSKMNPAEAIVEAHKAGQKVFGENKVQELKDKQEILTNLNNDIDWHLIGHLQSNKVKYIIGKVKMIHSVDSLSLAEEISRLSVKNNVNTDILIEVNIADEDSKFGITAASCEAVVREIAVLPNITIKGLMCIAPQTDCPEDNRQYFVKLRNLSVDINSKNIDNVNMCELSMGMTGDYEVAIEEGATFVRVGTGIFGKRNYGI